MNFLPFFLLPMLTVLGVPAPKAPPPKAPEVPKDLPPQIETLQPGVKLTLLATMAVSGANRSVSRKSRKPIS